MDAEKIEQLLKDGATKQELFENIRKLMLNQVKSQKTMVKLVESLVAQEMKHDSKNKSISVSDWEEKFMEYVPWVFDTRQSMKRKISKFIERQNQRAKYGQLKSHMDAVEKLLEGIQTKEA